MQQSDNTRREAGMAAISLLFWAMILVLGTVVVIKIIPVYYEYWSIVNAVKAQSQSTDAVARSKEIREALMKRLDVADVRDIKPDEILIERDQQNNVNIEVIYARKVKIMANVSLCFDFDAKASGQAVGGN